MTSQSFLMSSMEDVVDPPLGADEAIIAKALRILEGRAANSGPLLSDPDVAGRFFRLRLGNGTREHFDVAFLDTRNRLIKVERLFSGSIDGAVIHPRVVVQHALAHKRVGRDSCKNGPKVS